LKQRFTRRAIRGVCLKVNYGTGKRVPQPTAELLRLPSSRLLWPHPRGATRRRNRRLALNIEAGAIYAE